MCSQIGHCDVAAGRCSPSRWRALACLAATDACRTAWPMLAACSFPAQRRRSSRCCSRSQCLEPSWRSWPTRCTYWWIMLRSTPSSSRSSSATLTLTLTLSLALILTLGLALALNLAIALTPTRSSLVISSAGPRTFLASGRATDAHCQATRRMRPLPARRAAGAPTLPLLTRRGI